MAKVPERSRIKTVATIRHATLDDVDEIIVKLAAATIESYKLIPDRERLRKVVTMAISSKQHAILVADTGSDITGLLMIGCGPFDIAKKLVGNIMFFLFNTLSDARALAALMLAWVRERRGIQLVYYNVPFFTFGIDVLEEAGFRNSGSMIYWRRQWDSSLNSGKE